MSEANQLQKIYEDPKLIAAIEKIRGLLTPGEAFQTYAAQERIHALFNRRIIVVATTGRLIFVFRGLFGGFRMVDVRWQDLKDAVISEGIFGSHLTAVRVKGQPIEARGLRKQQAQQLYVICQTQEQVWREKNRVREMEEMRAKSGGVHLGSGGMAAPAVAAPAVDPVAKLQKAKEMLDRGLISDVEYETIKAKVFAEM